MSQVTRYQNAALNYYMRLTNSPYLHYGYWNPLPSEPQDLTVPQFRKAQQAYADKLFSFIPPQIKTVLDVGCGIGGNAAYLLAQGFKVEGLAPDSFQEEKFLENTNHQAKFYLTKFEDFQTNHTYDLILLSESSQYMAADDIARCAANLLDSGGYLLLADMMRSNPEYKEGIFSNCHVVAELHKALMQAGFTLVKAEDISTEIAPSLDLYIESFQTWGLSTIKYIADLVSIAVPPIYLLFRWIYKRWIKKLIVEGLEAKNIFEKHLCYQIQLWQLVEKK
ncbi:class I SAM-dependent methyltransferase [Ancylothrix sp. C2]|uniref:class I SAM-dependent methyltransferase n=1 Tax=Ancylothrix sp. D3o TaxID=2953691 RepID=UPI0021BAB42E|nr:class I SAM-dependent methyltransferase [Ancylothrix sp. D3o]MCT7948927.1 class I SAM-dependent methyltransferase [Ancylothrix sp. D3o]